MDLLLDPTDPASMTAEERMEEIASIFAHGITRLKSRSALPAPPALTTGDADSTNNGLDVCDQKSVHAAASS
jgi:hypothetical protein